MMQSEQTQLSFQEVRLKQWGAMPNGESSRKSQNQWDVTKLFFFQGSFIPSLFYSYFYLKEPKKR